MNSRLLALLTITIATLVAPVGYAAQQEKNKPLSVNELVAKPNAHVGKVAVVGRVAAATSGKGFTLVDSTTCANCTTECPTDKSTKKIPFLWNGAAPAVKGVVLVQGVLAKTPKGFVFTAQKVEKHD